MSFLGLGNPASGSGKQFKQARSTFNKTSNQAVGLINAGTGQAKNTITNFQNTLKQGVPPVNMGGTGAGLAGGIKDGNVSLDRTGETQGWMDTLGKGLSTDQKSYNTLLGQIAPGFGQLSQSAENTIRNDYAKRYGDLKSQLAQRRLLGSSLANGQLESMQRQETLDVQAAKADAITKELNMTQSVLQDRTNARIATTNQALGQINYETGVRATLLANTQNIGAQVLNAQTDLAKLLASLQASGGIAAGDVTANLGSASAQTFPQQAQLMAEGKQAQNNSIGSLIGAGFGMFNFGGGGGTATA